MELYQAYACRKMTESNNPQMVFGNLKFETSVDNKCIRITVMDFEERDIETKPIKKKSWFAKLKKSLSLRREDRNIFSSYIYNYL